MLSLDARQLYPAAWMLMLAGCHARSKKHEDSSGLH